MRKIFTFIFTTFLLYTSSAQDNSVLSTGQWIQITIEKDGVYKLSYDALRNAGIDVNGINPKNLRVHGNGGGMLPQSTSDNRAIDLVENAILVIGEEDERFDPSDFIVFYAQGPDKYEYDGDTLHYEHNIFANENYYYVTVGESTGLRVSDLPNIETSQESIITFDDFGYHEIELSNLLISGREWYGERFNTTTSYSFNFPMPGLLPDTDIKITSAVMAQSFDPSKFDITVNGALAGSQEMGLTPNFREPQVNNPNRYSVKGKERTDVFFTSSGNNSSSVDVTMNFQKGSAIVSVGYLNYLQVEAKRRLELSGNYTIFRNLTSTESAISKYAVGNVNSGTLIWDITESLKPKNQVFETISNQGVFGHLSSELSQFVVFDINQLESPQTLNILPNQNLRGVPAPNFLIVTHPDFLSEANRLADFRRTNDNMEVKVVTTTQVYHEFSSGKPDFTAIRDYTRHLYKKGNKLQYLLLFGKGSYDYKDIIPDNTNYVPIYESRNSLDPLLTYASDDYYGFLEDEEGEWLEERGGNHTLDIGVGRLPVSTVNEAKGVVDKIIRYATDPRSVGAWKNKVVFIADDEDGNLHQRDANRLTNLIEDSFAAFSPDRLYLDNFPQIPQANGEAAPKANDAIDERVNQGSFIVNFTGHGGEIGWMDEQVLDLFMIERWNNSFKLPLFVTATCEFSRHDDPRRVSGGERVVTNENGGGIAIISTCRPVFANSNFELNRSFYEYVFTKVDGQYLRLGDIFRLTKNESIDLAIDSKKVGNRNFALLGDPSMRLSYPENDVVITSINNNPIATDTLNSLSKNIISGEVRDASGSVDQNFNGTVEMSVFDKQVELTTLGNRNNTPFNYDSYENIIFKGEAMVTNGKFNIEFIIPKNISFRFGAGKVNFYAKEESGMREANGANIDLIIGGTIEPEIVDTEGPEIKLFVEDPVKGRTTGVSHNTTLFANLIDESGINLSSFSTGNNITAELDDDELFVLNNFYKAINGSFKEGWVSFPLADLSEGKHKIQFRASDTFNNSSEAIVEFVVADPSNLFIRDLINIPNPFSEATSFSFNHNRSGEDLEINLQIFNRIGSKIVDANFEIDNSEARVNLFDWSGENASGTKFHSGIYLYKVVVRSKLDGAKSQEFQKLILFN